MDLDHFYADLGTRIAARRRALRLTQAELAARIGLTRTSIANIEAGRQRTLAHQLGGIANALDLGLSALLPDLSGASSAEVAIGVPVSGAVPTAHERWQIEKILAALPGNKMQSDKPVIDERTHVGAREATDLLAKLGTDTLPVPVEQLAELAGAQVRFGPMDSELSSFVLNRRGTAVIGVNDQKPLTRQRFAIAHEIGHILLHADLLADVVHIDKEFKLAELQGRDSWFEAEASQFAMELLIPSQRLRRELVNGWDIDDPTRVEALAELFGVKAATIHYRLSDSLRRNE